MSVIYVFACDSGHFPLVTNLGAVVDVLPRLREHFLFSYIMMCNGNACAKPIYDTL